MEIVVKVYMKVTPDKYQLPLAIADSPAELSRMTGVSRNAISSAISHGKHDSLNRSYVKVEWEEEDDET